MNDERLRQLLRQGDPAGEDGGLTTDEARALRRTVLTAIPERRRLLPVLALAGALATAALIAVLLLRPEPAKAPATTPRIATAPVPPAPPVAQAPVQPAPRPAPKEAEPRPVHPRHHPRPRVPVVPATPEIHDTLASLETAEPERQVQFSTPGGTRIIWILKSGKASR